MHNYERLRFNWKEFNFDKKYMVNDVFETLEAHNNQWNYPQYTMDIQSKFLMACRSYDVKGYYKEMNAYDFGDITLKFSMHEDVDGNGYRDEISYNMIMEYEKFELKIIQVIKDDTVLKQWTRS